LTAASGSFTVAAFPKTFPKQDGIVATIKELAKQSGVSVATVSRVLNGYPDVREETRKRVLTIARELDYTPSAAAQSMVRKRTHVIGVLLDTGAGHPDIHHPFFQEVLVGLKHGVGELGFDLLLFATDQPGNGFDSPSILRRARHHGVDGVVLMGVDPADAEVQRLVRSGIPCVAVDLDLIGPRTGYVMSDNAEGARLAVRHLRELGHERIATIHGPVATRPGVDRLVGYRLELERLGIQIPDGYEQAGDFYPESGQTAMEALLDLPEPPTAVFAASDLMAIGAIRTAQARGVRVPDELSIVGFDDIQLAPLMHPALTTIRQDKTGLGFAAADALVRMVERPGAGAPATALPVSLVRRESTAPHRLLDDDRR
jgi:LacI family transcriptional regulator